MREDRFILCEKCKKKLIRKLPDGTIEFKYGKAKNRFGSPVQMKINGMIQMKCIGNHCGHWNTISSNST